VTQTWDSELPCVTFGPTKFRYGARKLSGDCAESANVAAAFHKGFRGARLVAAWRIQNKPLLRSFQNHARELREGLAADGIADCVHYRIGFHGTRTAEAVHSICQDGYDLIYSSEGLNAYGYGVYHARDARMSDQYACDTPTELQQQPVAAAGGAGVATGATRTQTMLLNILTVADVVQGRSRQLKPEINPASAHSRRFSTFTDTGAADSARIFVSTNNAQAYPAYILNYTHS
jgi:hypothetical protein